MSVGADQITLAPVDPAADADLIHEWVSQERAEFWGMRGKSREAALVVARAEPSTDTMRVAPAGLTLARALFARLISWSRSNVVEPTSAWSLPAPSPASRIRSASSTSARLSSERSRSRSAFSSSRTSPSSFAVHGFSSAFTASLSAVFLEGAIFFTGAFCAGDEVALPVADVATAVFFTVVLSAAGVSAAVRVLVLLALLVLLTTLGAGSSFGFRRSTPSL